MAPGHLIPLASENTETHTHTHPHKGSVFLHVQDKNDSEMVEQTSAVRVPGRLRVRHRYRARHGIMWTGSTGTLVGAAPFDPRSPSVRTMSNIGVHKGHGPWL